MPKINPLAQGLEQHRSSAKATSTVPRQTASKSAVPSRSGRVLIGGHFAPEVQTALKIVAAEERTTIQALLAEAINTVFAKRGKPEIADIGTS
ncbi:MAG: hypothetical protein M3Y72_03065 [Acidobacteriota bacterium]|nr:hypothetical protein [Acidobacteriota bacterium]